MINRTGPAYVLNIVTDVCYSKWLDRDTGNHRDVVLSKAWLKAAKHIAKCANHRVLETLGFHRWVVEGESAGTDYFDSKRDVEGW